MPTPTLDNELIDFNGRKITYARWKFEQTRQQEAVLRRVNDLITDEATQIANLGRTLAQQEYGGFLRTVVPNLLDKYGKVNAKAAIDFYNQAREQWWSTRTQSLSRQYRKNQNRMASRNAAAKLKSELAIARGYQAQFADTYDAIGKSDAVINYAMKVREKYGHAPSINAMNNALTREVAMYHRDTVLFNSALDPYVKRVQRVAQANACEFCRLMALSSRDGSVKTSTYAVHFHNHCHCTIQPLYDGDVPVRPDYYDEFEDEYVQAKSQWNGSNSDTQQTLANWREIRKAKAAKPAAPQLIDVFDDTKAARELIKDAYSSQTFAGFKANVEIVTRTGELLEVSGAIEASTGEQAGMFRRLFYNTNDKLTVYHDYLEIVPRYRGQGFGTEFSKWSENWYRQNGVQEIELQAAMSDGAYTWAKAGYSWKSEPFKVKRAIKDVAKGNVELIGVDAATADELRGRLTRLAEKLDGDFNSVDYPQPFEIANMEGPDIDGMSFGRWLLNGTNWFGVKKL